jgi:transposase
MAFNLGAFAGGLASAGLKTYTTLKEQERLEGIEARDKERFEEERRLITQRQESEALQRKAAIPDAADQPGRDINAVVSALPIGGSETSPGDLTKTTDAYQQKFKDVFGGLTPEQQALVLRQYGDTSTPGGAALQQTQAAAGAPEALAGLNAAVIRQDAGGGRSVVTADTDEKKTVARYKAMAMASGNPVAIKAANEAEATMLNRQVAEQSIEVGKQNIEKNVLELTKLRDAATFKTKFNTQLEAVTKENNALSLSIEQAAKDPNVTVDSLVKTYGGKIKDLTGTALLAEDGVVYTTDAGGKKIVLASSKEQAIDLLRTNASQYFAQNLSNKVIANGLFENVEAFNTFYERERKYVMDAAGLANSRVMAAAATKNAESSATSAAASVTTAQAAASRAKADTDLVAAQLAAGGPKAEADYKKAQAAQAQSQASYYGALKAAADDERTTGQAATRAMKPLLEAYAKLSRDDQLSDKGQALLDQAAAASITDAKGASQVLTALKRPDKSGIEADWAAIEKSMYANSTPQPEIAAARVAFFASRGVAPSAATQAVLLGKGSDGKPMTEADVDNFNAMFPNSKINKAALQWLKPAAAATTTPAAAAPAALKVAPVVGPGGLPAPNPQLAVPATATDTAGKRTVIPAVKAADAAITNAGLQSIKDKIAKNQKLTGVERAQAVRAGLLPASAIPPKDKSAGPSAAELAEDAAVDKLNAELAAKKKAAPAAPAGKSVAAQEEDLSYKVIVAQSNYDRRPGATTKAQLASAQQELANFRKANGIK